MTASDANERTMGNLKSAAQQAEDTMNATTAHAGQTLSELRTRLSAALDSAKATAHRVNEKTAAAAKATDQCIREHPYQTMGIAFGVGLVLGLLISRR